MTGDDQTARALSPTIPWSAEEVAAAIYGVPIHVSPWADGVPLTRRCEMARMLGALALTPVEWSTVQASVAPARGGAR
jgi:hypothetical protein